MTDCNLEGQIFPEPYGPQINITSDPNYTAEQTFANITLERVQQLYERLLTPTPTEQMANRISGTTANQSHLHRNGVRIVDGKIVSIMDDTDDEESEL